MKAEIIDRMAELVSACYPPVEVSQKRSWEIQIIDDMDILWNVWNLSSLESEEYLLAEKRMKEIIAEISSDNMPDWFLKMIETKEIPSCIQAEVLAKTRFLLSQ